MDADPMSTLAAQTAVRARDFFTATAIVQVRERKGDLLARIVRALPHDEEPDSGGGDCTLEARASGASGLIEVRVHLIRRDAFEPRDLLLLEKLAEDLAARLLPVRIGQSRD